MAIPVFNLDGAIIAIAGNPGGEPYAYPVEEVAKALIARAAAGARFASFGMAFQDLSGPLRTAFGDQGVLICAVADGGPADSAGIGTGDILLAIGDLDVTSSDAASRMLRDIAPGSHTKLRVLTRGRARTVDVTPALAYEVAALARAGAMPIRDRTEARVLFLAPLLDRAGIPHTARVLSMNGRIVSSRAQAARELRQRGSPARLLLWDEGRQFFAVIGPDQ